jgi:hypothetical protein
MLLLALALVSAPVDDAIARGEREMAALEYDTAADAFAAAASDKSASDSQKEHAGLLAGVCYRIAGRDVEARLAFRAVLLRNPSATLPPDTAPKVVAFFALVQQELAAEQERASLRPSTAAATTTTTPASPAPPAPIAPSPSSSGASIVPLVVAGVGGAGLVAGGALAAVSEASLGDAQLDFAHKQNTLFVGRTGLVVAGAGFVVAAVGAVWEVLE